MESESSGSDRATYALRFALDSEHPEFLRGCEAGYIAAKAQFLGHVTLRELMHRDNQEMLRRIAEAEGRTFDIHVIDDDWMAVTLDPAPNGHSDIASERERRFY